MLCGNAYSLMQELRCEICSVRPDDRVELWVQANTAKCGEIAERLEDGAVKFAAQVNFAGEAITET